MGRLSPKYLIIAGIAIVALLSIHQHSNIGHRVEPARAAWRETEKAHAAESVHQYSKYVLGPPTMRFRDNLRSDVQYVTSWPDNGMTNTFMGYNALLWHAILTRRVAVLPAFQPMHIGPSPIVAYGDVFDVPRLARSLGVGIIEWRDLKLPFQAEGEFEELGCWSHNRVTLGAYVESAMANELGLDVSLNSAPQMVLMPGQSSRPPFANAFVIAALHYNETRHQAIAHPPYPPVPNRKGNLIPPDDHMMCIDFMYAVGVKGYYEWEYEWQPSWTQVGQYVHFTPRVIALTQAALRRAFGLSPDVDIPPYVAVHVRHGDFDGGCSEGTTLETCYAPLSTYAKRVAEVQVELRERHGVEAKHVLMTSDEQDKTWWEGVHQLGWAYIDFANEPEDEILTKWYPIVVDSAAHSMAAGFVGTERSTVSLMAVRRITAWGYGVVRTVNWGWPDADAQLPQKGHTADISNND